jgi:formylglycine-generating enzyme required for sulfatase activity
MGALDLAGNVWEWCLNEYDKPERQVGKGDARRVVRGGSWLNYRDPARCAYRSGLAPGSRGRGLGLRLVCVAPIA